jgi:hypothetical protein
MYLKRRVSIALGTTRFLSSLTFHISLLALSFFFIKKKKQTMSSLQPGSRVLVTGVSIIQWPIYNDDTCY